MNGRILSRIVGAYWIFSIATIGNATVQEGQTAFANWERCNALRNITIPAASIGLPTDGARVTKAELIPAGGTRLKVEHDADGQQKRVPVSTDDLNPYGEYCLVEGEILPVKPNTNKIVLHLALPSRWNGKSLHTDGRLNIKQPAPPAPVHPLNNVLSIAPPLPIARGYAVYSREWGTDEPLFQQHAEPTKKAHDLAMFLTGRYYGKAARHRYYSGAGGTGYESLALIQKYPEDYDGILTQCPVFSITLPLKGQVIRRAMESHGGVGEVSAVKAAFLRKKVLSSCDKLDGLEDAVVSNVEACRIDFAKLRCPNGKDSGDDCFSDAQLNTLQVLHTSVKLPYALPSGETHLPAFSIGADWDSTTRSDPANKAWFKGGEKATRDLFLGGDPQANVLAFDPLKPNKKVLVRIQEMSRLYDRSAPDIDRFIARGGKWILTHGWADDHAPTTSSIEYYRKLVAKYSQTKVDEVMRLYLIPGHGHAAGVAFNGNGAPNLEALEDWVERGLTPGTLTVVDTNRGGKGRSRPMCVYPAWPKYNGSGNPDLATSFTCVTGPVALSAPAVRACDPSDHAFVCGLQSPRPGFVFDAGRERPDMDAIGSR